MGKHRPDRAVLEKRSYRRSQQKDINLSGELEAAR